MSNVKAPCGHPGEVVIGTYVRCVMGCEGAKEKPKRAQPGHVLNCACKPCQVRQRTTHILLKTKDGKELKVAWDGVTDKVNWTAPWTGELRHYKFLDADGDEIASGFLDLAVTNGEAMYLHPQLIADKLTMSVTIDEGASGWKWKKLPKVVDNPAVDLGIYEPFAKATADAPLSTYILPLDAYGDPKGHYDKWANALKGIPFTKDMLRWKDARKTDQVAQRATLRQAAKMQNFGIGSAWGYGARPPRGTVDDLRDLALSIPDIKDVKIWSPVHGEVEVLVLDTDCVDPQGEYAAADLLRKDLEIFGAAGVSYAVRLDTPMQKLMAVCNAAESEVSRVWLVDNVIPAAFRNSICGRLRKGGEEYEGYRLVQIDMEGGQGRYVAHFEIDMGLYRKHCRVPLRY